MSLYTLINLKDVEDSAKAHSQGVEGRFARKQLDSRELGGQLLPLCPRLSVARGVRPRSASARSRSM
jgi:hypothetical protein